MTMPLPARTRVHVPAASLADQLAAGVLDPDFGRVLYLFRAIR
jgi:hypothetical protein